MSPGWKSVLTCHFSTAAFTWQSGANQVSGRSLPKTGISAKPGRDFRRSGRPKAPNGKMETRLQVRESPPMAGFSRTPRSVPTKARLPGWRRSPDRTSLQANSLQTGNFSGNFAIPGLLERRPWQEIPVLQSFLHGFPTQANREEISKNREFLIRYREHLPPGQESQPCQSGAAPSGRLPLSGVRVTGPLHR